MNIFNRFNTLNKNVKYEIAQQLPQHFISKYQNTQFVDEFLKVYCEYCKNSKEKTDDGNKCFTIVCRDGHFINMEMYDNCSKCEKAVEFSGNEEVVFYCEDCVWWWSYHEKYDDATKTYQLCKNKAEFMDWGTYQYDDLCTPELASKIMPDMDEGHAPSELYTKEEWDNYMDAWTEYETTEKECCFQQGNHIRFKCVDCNEIFLIDPIGS